MADQKDGGAELGAQVPDQVEHRWPRPWRPRPVHGLIEDQQRGVLRQRHRDHHALLHPARKLVRIARHHPRRSRDLHSREHRLGLGERRSARAAEQLVGFRDLPPDCECRVQRAAGVLIDHRERARPQPAKCRGIKLGQHLPAHRDAARAHVAVARQRADRSQRRGRFAAAAFSDQPVGFAATHRERHVTQHRKIAAAHAIGDLHALQQQRVGAHGEGAS